MTDSLKPKFDSSIGKTVHPVVDPVTGHVTWVPENMLITEGMHPNLGSVRSEFSKERMREAKEKNRTTCMYCGVETAASNITMYHNEHCKKNPNRVEPVLHGFLSHNEEQQKKFKETREKNKQTCEHCGITAYARIISQVHGRYCKKNPNRVIKPKRVQTEKAKKNVVAGVKATSETCSFCGKKYPRSTIVQFHNEFCKENPNRIEPPKRKHGSAKCTHCGETHSKRVITRFHNEFCESNPNRVVKKKRIVSDKQKQKYKATQKANMESCTVCGKKTTKAAIVRFHNDKCKHNSTNK
jgi:hypothetical protein